ncbi:MAG: D-alanyl-D-alanine carboxypeptidase [Parachlamydiaceae bacterium]|nr:D-alanyl-D-alanine carboxypeptidase [Parachlamydiaceae bacterium]
MLRWIVVVFACQILCISATPLQIEIDAEGVILINANTNVILYEKNAYKQYHPASTTKVATALYALEKNSSRLDEIIVADRESLASISPDAKRKSNYMLPAYWLETDGTHIGIKNEEKLSLKDLLFGMMVASGNDAANLIAKNVGGSIPAFIEQLNAYLKELGCKNTTFCNPHGLHHPNHLTTPYDMALMAKEALKNPLFQEIVKTQRFMRPKTNKQESLPLMQTNHLVRKGKPHFYAKAIGVKTGYVAAAQHTLVAAARDGDRTLISVLFKSKNRKDCFSETIKLFEAAFNEPKVERILFRAGIQNYVLELDGAVKPIRTYLSSNVTIQYYPAEEPELQCILKWREISLPIEKNQIIGDLQIQNVRGKVIQQIPLLAEESVSASWSHWLRSFF